MINLYNLITLITLARFPLAFCFLSPLPSLRCAAIFLAMASDILDGYLARKHKATSTTGALLDPLMDKWFTGFALAVFYLEGALTPLSLLLLFSRDLALFLYGLWALFSGRLSHQKWGSLITGKIATSLQIIFLALLALGVKLSYQPFLLFIPLLPFVFWEAGSKSFPNPNRTNSLQPYKK